MTAPHSLTAALPSGSLRGRRYWLFDLDGTLVDSGPAHEAAFRAALARLAPELLGSFRYDARAGASTRQVVTALGAAPEVVEPLIRLKQRLYRESVAAGKVAVFPGAHRLLDLLTGRGHQVYLVTSGSRGSVERVLAAGALADRFRGVLTGDDVPVSKPDPEFYRHACRLWGIPADAAVAVEDSAHGTASALGAGLVTIQVHAAEPAPGALAVRDLAEIVSFLDLEVNSGE